VRLFRNAGNTAALTAGYTPGDTVVATSAGATFEYLDGTPGVARVTNLAGDTFLLSYEEVVGGELRGVSTSGIRGTTAVAAAAGSQVANVVHLQAPPARLAARVLASTGAGTNGVHDVLPESWGYGLPGDWLDQRGIADVDARVLYVAGGSSWSVLVEAPVDDGMAWLRDLLAPAGVWLCARQGRITARAAQAVDQLEARLLATGLALGWAELGAELELDAWDAETTPEWRQLEVVANGGATRVVRPVAPEVGSYPADRVLEVDLSEVVIDNASAHALATARRLQPWATRPAERLRCRAPGLAAARLAPGDVVRLMGAELPLPCRQRVLGGSSSWLAMVASVAPDWAAGAVALELVWHPSWQGARP
jgi:hypothetical protein